MSLKSSLNQILNRNFQNSIVTVNNMKKNIDKELKENNILEIILLKNNEIDLFKQIYLHINVQKYLIPRSNHSFQYYDCSFISIQFGLIYEIILLLCYLYNDFDIAYKFTDHILLQLTKDNFPMCIITNDKMEMDLLYNKKDVIYYLYTKLYDLHYFDFYDRIINSSFYNFFNNKFDETSIWEKKIEILILEQNLLNKKREFDTKNYEKKRKLSINS
jgi:hypothetical protein